MFSFLNVDFINKQASTFPHYQAFNLLIDRNVATELTFPETPPATIGTCQWYAA